MTGETWFDVLGVAAGATGIAIGFLANLAARNGRSASRQDFAREARQVIAEYQKAQAERRLVASSVAVRRRSAAERSAARRSTTA